MKMTCTLNQLTSYNVGRVIHDNESGVYTAQLVNAPTSCPDTVFTSKKAQIKIVEGANPELMFDMVQKKPVIVVPRKEYIEQVGNAGFGFGFYLLVVIALGLIGTYLFYRRQQSDTARAGTPPSEPTYGSGGNATAGRNFSAGSGSKGGYASSGRVSPITPVAAPAQQQAAAPTTVINNNGGGNDGLLTGLVIGNMLSNNNRSERVVEHETIIERQAPASTFSSDSDSSDKAESSSDYSSDSDSSSSFSSDNDSSSSYSSDSDSGSSYSSDSGSSDSGGSFSSDS
jgi:hypothetical protein